MDPDAVAINAAIAAGDDQTAFSQLRTRLSWPRGKDVADLATWLAIIGTLAARRGATTLADLAAAAVADPDSPDRLYELGYALIDAGAPAVAATVLWRCLALVGDSEEVVCELVSALESALEYRDALAILEEHTALRARSFLCRYLYAFNAAMSGRLDVTREALAALAPETPETEVMRAAIAAIVARAERVAGVSSLDDRDLRGWHYVLSGGLVIHQSPYGFDTPMHGRYAWLQDSASRIATGIDRLAQLAPNASCVYAPPGRSHEIVAHAIAKRLGIPFAPWPAIGVPAPGLVAIYDLTELPTTEVTRLLQRRPDQILFAHASPWTRDAAIAPDVTTLLYQSLVAPWAESTIVDPDTHEVRRAPADSRSAEALGASIAESPGLDDAELAADEPARWTQLVTRVWPLEPGARSRLWAGGPVPSNRFA